MLQHFQQTGERKFITYCALHLGHPKQHPSPTKHKLIQEVFSILRSADRALAIQPYLDSYKVNSVCHASHLVDNATELENYFPEIRYYHKRFRTKCRFISSVPLPEIKNIKSSINSVYMIFGSTQLLVKVTKRNGLGIFYMPIQTTLLDQISWVYSHYLKTMILLRYYRTIMYLIDLRHKIADLENSHPFFW